MSDPSLWTLYGEAARTLFGFFWKSGWAFVFGSTFSAGTATVVLALAITGGAA